MKYVAFAALRVSFVRWSSSLRASSWLGVASWVISGAEASSSHWPLTCGVVLPCVPLLACDANPDTSSQVCKQTQTNSRANLLWCSLPEKVRAFWSTGALWINIPVTSSHLTVLLICHGLASFQLLWKFVFQIQSGRTQAFFRPVILLTGC